LRQEIVEVMRIVADQGLRIDGERLAVMVSGAALSEP
jgi:hypothetical protein